MQLDDQHYLILDYLTHTNRSIFLTGKAGTGKTTFMHYIRHHTAKELVVVAPTAVAAINASGMTVHSFFQIPPGPLLPTVGNEGQSEQVGLVVSLEKEKILRRLQLLIIDEISMVRADVLDYIDLLLRRVRLSSRPFGGVQLLMIGDLYQLPPVTKNDWQSLSSIYKSPYFFDSLVWKHSTFLTFELLLVHRQKDPVFVEILNSIRVGDMTAEALAALNLMADRAPDLDLSDYVTLSTHNHKVNQINQQRLQQLPTQEHLFSAAVSGVFPQDAYPTEAELTLREGAHVMFIKNDSSGKKQYYNGRTAVVNRIEDGRVHVKFTDDESEFTVAPETWQNVKYAVSEREGKINESAAGTFSQLPIRLSWAVTIHKSQGLTFEKLVVDLRSAFAPGQVYVALSRCRSLEGLVLLEPLSMNAIKVDRAVKGFMQNADVNKSDRAILVAIQRQDLAAAIVDIFDFEQLVQCWDRVQRFMQENVRPLPDQVAAVDKLERAIKADLVKVAANFIRKELEDILDQATVQAHDPLSERLRKAIDYFSTKLQEIVGPLDRMLANYAHRHVAPEFHLTLKLLKGGITLKMHIFSGIGQAATLDELAVISQNVLSDYSQQAIKAKPLKSRQDQPVVDEKLMNNLIDWRQGVASQRSVQPYMIVSDSVLSQIAYKRPASLTELSQIKNFGEVKAIDFGVDILRIVLANSGSSELFS